MSKNVSLLLILVVVLSTLGFGEELKIANTWIQAIPPGSEVTAAYMTILNTSQKPFELVGAASTIAKKIEPMLTTQKTEKGQKIMGMESVPNMAIAPGETLVLKPGGNHLMLMGLTSHPKEGDRVHLTLRFNPGAISVDLVVPVYKQPPK